MAVVDIGMRSLSNRLPKVISPRNHAIIDYASVGAFALMGLLFWKRDQKRAAISSWACAGQQLTLAMLTDFPGGIAKVISLPTHGKIDAAFAGIVGTTPSLLGFSNEWPSIFFRSQAVGLAAVTGMTEFEPERIRRYRQAA